MGQLNFFQPETNGYKDRHVAKVKSSGKLLFSVSDLSQEANCWFNMENGKSPDCMVVMDHKRFMELYSNGQIEIIKSDLLK